MGSTSIILGEAGVPTSPTILSAPTSPARGGLSTLESTIGGKVVLFSVASGGGVAVPASSANESTTTLGSGDLVREGDACAHRSCWGSATNLHKNTTIKQRIYNTTATS
jgi:hypothetical protein